MKTILTLSAALLVTSLAGAASFEMQSVAGLPGVKYSAVAWGDYDNDGRLDLLITGDSGPDNQPSGVAVAQLWRNTGSGLTNVTDQLVPALPQVYDGSVAWADYDNDGRLDFLITGNEGTSNISQLWRNTGSGFVAAPIAGLPGVRRSSVAWGDYDTDGRPDFLLTGSTGAASISQLWRNTGSGFTNIPIAGLPGVAGSCVAWGDYDNDGRLDFLLTGTTDGSDFGRVSQLWRNTGSGFANVSVAGLPGAYGGSVAWGDYDNDGRLDFLLAGSVGQGGYVSVSQLWRNTGSGFTNVPIPGLRGLGSSSVAWGDYDNDGRLDFLVSGWPSSAANMVGSTSELWRNTGNGFTNVTNEVSNSLAGLVRGAVAWADYDNDGRLDFILTGTCFCGAGTVSQLWRNTASAGNAPPSAPAGLSTQVDTNSITLSWLPASDDHTPAPGLTYNVVIATTPDGVDLAAPMANRSDGFRRVVRLGGANHRTSCSFTNLPPAPAYYWSVQAIDTSFKGGLFAPAQYLPQTASHGVSLPAPGQVALSFPGISGQTYVIERSDDLTHWTGAGSPTETPAGSGRFTFLDTSADASRRFYRIR